MDDTTTYRHPTSLGEVIIKAHYDDHGQPESVEVLSADPRVLIGGDFLRAIHHGEQFPRLPFAMVNKAEVGGVLRINASNRQLVYLITEYEPTINGWRAADTYVGAWPD